MFIQDSEFNQNIGSWNVASIMNAQSMFAGAEKFNQDISGWNVASITNAQFMFAGAEKFNQNLCGWFDFPNSIDLKFMLGNTACDVLKIDMMHMTPSNKFYVCQKCN